MNKLKKISQLKYLSIEAEVSNTEKKSSTYKLRSPVIKRYEKKIKQIK